MKQSRLMSWVETILNTSIGFAIAITAQLLVFPLFGFSPPLSHNLAIGAIFTVVSILRGFALRRLFEALHIRMPISPSLLAIAAERRRQIDVEGWTAEHDRAHGPGELARAGAAYAQMPARRFHNGIDDASPMCWPWDSNWWKPRDNRRDLVRAGALIVAELDRLNDTRRAR